MTDLVQIRTVEQLREFMCLNKSAAGEPTVSDEDLFWFICIQEAECVVDSYRLKDIASLFREGIRAINTLEQVQDYLDNRFPEGEEEYHEEYNVYLLAAVYRFYGMHDIADKLVDGEDE